MGVFPESFGPGFLLIGWEDGMFVVLCGWLKGWRVRGNALLQLPLDGPTKMRLYLQVLTKNMLFMILHNCTL